MKTIKDILKPLEGKTCVLITVEKKLIGQLHIDEKSFTISDHKAKERYVMSYNEKLYCIKIGKVNEIFIWEQCCF